MKYKDVIKSIMLISDYLSSIICLKIVPNKKAQASVSVYMKILKWVVALSFAGVIIGWVIYKFFYVGRGEDTAHQIADSFRGETNPLEEMS